MTSNISHFDMAELTYAYGQPQAKAQLKWSPEDFKVEEQIAFPLSGEGEHLWLWIEKIGQNTDWVVKQLAAFVGVTSREMGVAGKKDRHAVTCQWVSCHLPGKADPDFSSLAIPGVRVLKTVRHNRKLQTGGLSGNRFELRLTDVQGDRAALEARLQTLKDQGFPNYFGDQRFGQAMQNLTQASRLFAGEIRPKRHQKSLYLSAARSWMFNQLLSERIRLGNWNQPVEGDAFQLEGSQKCFVSPLDDDIRQRIQNLDIHPTGLLTGRGRSLVTGEVADMEQAVISAYPLWQSGLEKFGLKQERRALRVLPKGLSWQWQDKGGMNSLILCFELPAGSYATMLVRECVLVV